MNKFKVGDHVAAYTTGGKIMGIVDSVETSRGFLGILAQDGEVYCYHIKQCRKLVKKERRRVWVNMKQPCLSFVPRPQIEGFIEFVEVKKK